jgi:hypothetical protein
MNPYRDSSIGLKGCSYSGWTQHPSCSSPGTNKHRGQRNKRNSADRIMFGWPASNLRQTARNKKEPVAQPALTSFLVYSGSLLLASVAVVRRRRMLIFTDRKTLVELTHFFDYSAIFKLTHREHRWSRETLSANLRGFD